MAINSYNSMQKGLIIVQIPARNEENTIGNTIKNIPRNCIKLNLKLILKCSRERQRIAMILNVRITQRQVFRIYLLHVNLPFSNEFVAMRNRSTTKTSKLENTEISDFFEVFNILFMILYILIIEK